MADNLTKEYLNYEEDTQKGKYLIFMIGNECYGIEILYVTEIIGVQSITEVPEFPEYVKGIINLRGKIIPVMDVRIRYKKPYKEYNNKTCIIVVDVKEISIGLIVDKVSEVLTIPDEDIVPPPRVNQGCSNKYIKGIGKIGNEVKLILDCNELVMEEIKEYS